MSRHGGGEKPDDRAVAARAADAGLPRPRRCAGVARAAVTGKGYTERSEGAEWRTEAEEWSSGGVVEFRATLELQHNENNGNGNQTKFSHSYISECFTQTVGMSDNEAQMAAQGGPRAPQGAQEAFR